MELKSRNGKLSDTDKILLGKLADQAA